MQQSQGIKKVLKKSIIHLLVHFPQSPKQLFCAPLKYSNFVFFISPPRGALNFLCTSKRLACEYTLLFCLSKFRNNIFITFFCTKSVLKFIVKGHHPVVKQKKGENYKVVKNIRETSNHEHYIHKPQYTLQSKQILKCYNLVICIIETIGVMGM